MKNLILGLIVLLCSCHPKPVTETELLKQDNTFALKDSILKLKQAVLEAQNKKADTVILQGKTVYLKAEKKIFNDPLPDSTKKDLTAFLRSDSVLHSDYESKIKVQDSILVNKDDQIALVKSYSDTLHTDLVREMAVNGTLEGKIIKLEKKVKRKNIRILEFLSFAVIGGTFAVLK